MKSQPTNWRGVRKAGPSQPCTCSKCLSLDTMIGFSVVIAHASLPVLGQAALVPPRDALSASRQDVAEELRVYEMIVNVP